MLAAFGPLVEFNLIAAEPFNLSCYLAYSEDSLGNSYLLLVGFVGTLPNTGGMKQLNLRLDSHLVTGSDIKITVELTSDLGLIRIQESEN